MHLVKEKLDIDESLNKKVTMVLKMLNIKAKLQNGNLISVSKTNLAYIEPHKLEIGNVTYLFFIDCNKIFINTLKKYYLNTNQIQNKAKLKQKLDLSQNSFKI